ncbi:his Kinase A domain protein [Lyngbya aestuarii BL J]|uniref:histidine kinase n=1 Tax=Lyngbya aestuarii BL J TaxID=1348334 RepID=U7QB12_9CYAN|nr:response regulator [Lyngbya aestuarii]ERT05008.1 his Kinase A domain protein [Lyngbya aestuarii BL J]
MNNTVSILIVDDQPHNFEVLETLLDKQGYILHYASSGVKALERLDNLQPDVILLDVMMPEIDGIEVCRRIKANQRWQHIPIIMLTALSSKKDLAVCLQAGANDFLSKPVNSVELRARLDSMIRIKKQYDHLQTSLKEQQSLLQMREDMVNMIVHDLRNPLASIIFETELLKHPKISPEKRDLKADKILETSKRLNALINSLLTMAKLESGKMVLNRCDIDLDEICRSAVENFAALASTKDIELLSDIPQQPCTINVDPPMFQRVLDNLLSNALKFSPSGSQIIFKAESVDAKGVQIKVIDSGPGVSEELRTSIFEKYKVGTLMKNVSQTGLGLAFCKVVVEAHGGTISVSENHPKGAIFTVQINSF